MDIIDLNAFIEQILKVVISLFGNKKLNHLQIICIMITN